MNVLKNVLSALKQSKKIKYAELKYVHNKIVKNAEIINAENVMQEVSYMKENVQINALSDSELIEKAGRARLRKVN